jgi:hypothetical protein
MARRNMAEPMKSAPQASITAAPGSTGVTIQTATARSRTPKKRRTPFIHAPARGSSAPSVTPTATSGTPIPSAMAKRAPPPSSTSRVCEI